jgi:SAM-dependent methyltransferase
MDNYSIHIQTAHKYWKELLLPSDNVIDATCGNGNDTLFLANILKEGKIFAYDIQEKALKNTLDLLKENHISLENISLIHQSHEDFSVKDNIKLIVYNLGYLPKGDKTITTQVGSTLKSINEGLNIISKGGALSITCYSGHLEGEKEENAILKMAAVLDGKKYSVCLHRWLNREKAPSLIWIKKF